MVSVQLGCYFSNNTVTVTTAGTRVQLSTAPEHIARIAFKAPGGNTGNVYVGDSQVSSTRGWTLAPGESITLDFSPKTEPLDSFYVDAATNGDKLEWIVGASVVTEGATHSHAHPAITGQTTGDHHAQNHATRHEPAGADTMAVDAAVGTGSLRTLGTGALQGAVGSHTTPAMTATAAGHVPTPPNNTTTFLRGDATFANPFVTTLTPQFARLGLGVAADGTIPLYVNSGIVGIGDNANANMSTGITINQGGADNQILDFKSSDVTTGLTSLTASVIDNNVQSVETDDFFTVSKLHTTLGGTLIYSLGGTGLDSTLRLVALTGGDATGKVATAVGAIELISWRHNGSNANAAFTVDTNALTIRVVDNGTISTRFIFDVEGTAHADVGTATYDDYNDIELLRGFLGVTVPGYQQRFGQALLYNQQTYEDLRLIGRDSLHWEPSRRYPGKMELRAMVNQTGLMMLHHSAIIQMHDRFSEIVQSHEARLATAEGVIETLRGQVKALEGVPER